MEMDWEVVCPVCGHTENIHSKIAREALDCRDFHQFDTSHVMDVYVFLDSRKVKLVGVFTNTRVAVDL